MIDHISIGVRDLEKARRFYEAVLATLGLAQMRDWPGAAAGYGKKHPEFWINHRPDMAASDSGMHICLRAPSTQAVDAFYAVTDAQGWVLGYTLERAIEALQRELGSST